MGNLTITKKDRILKVLSESFHQAAVPGYDAELENIFNMPKGEEVNP
jgi:hypothetical protein